MIKEIMIKTSQNPIIYKIKRSFRKGREQKEDGAKLQKNEVTRTRLMVTFSDIFGYHSLLNDHEELQKLKKNSYVDLEYLQRYGQFRVHLYYEDNIRTRIKDFEAKYPFIYKHVELDTDDIRLIVDDISGQNKQDNDESSSEKVLFKKALTPSSPRQEQEQISFIDEEAFTQTNWTWNCQEKNSKGSHEEGQEDNKSSSFINSEDEVVIPVKGTHLVLENTI